MDLSKNKSHCIPYRPSEQKLSGNLLYLALVIKTKSASSKKYKNSLCDPKQLGLSTKNGGNGYELHYFSLIERVVLIPKTRSILQSHEISKG